jgi:hypothetical protein
MAYQITQAANGTQIIAVAGLPDFTAGGLTSGDIDNMIAHAINNNIPSNEKICRDVFNKWLIECDVNGISQDEIDLANTCFLWLCYYSFAKIGFLQLSMTGQCDCDCTKRNDEYMGRLANGQICRIYGALSACMLSKWKTWLHKICDNESDISGMYGSDMIVKEEPLPLPLGFMLFGYGSSFIVNDLNGQSGGCVNCGA